MAQVHVKIDPEMCIGAASCVAMAPDIFQLNADNKATLVPSVERPFELIGDMSPEAVERVLLAAQSCPVIAVSVFDASGAPLYPEF